MCVWGGGGRRGLEDRVGMGMGGRGDCVGGTFVLAEYPLSNGFQ